MHLHFLLTGREYILMIEDHLMTDRPEGQWWQSGDTTYMTQQKCGICKGELLYEIPKERVPLSL